MNYRTKISLPLYLPFLLGVMTTGCAGNTNNTTLSYSNLSDKDLTRKIVLNFIIPSAYKSYSEDIKIKDNPFTGLEDVVTHHASCMFHELEDHATRMDLEVINSLWVENNGSTKELIIDSWGHRVYSSGVNAYSDASFNCIIETEKWINRTIEQ